MNRAVTLLGLLIFALAVTAAAPFFGIETLPLRAVCSGGGQDQGDRAAGETPADDATSMQAYVFWRIRIPRVIVAFLAGAGLAVSGTTFQAMFRNPLAEPFTLGVASGASLGAAIAINLRLAFIVAGISTVSIAAFLGAVLVVAFVYGLTRLRRGFSATSMLLAGVAVSFFCSSLILLVQYLSDFTQTFRMLRWVMGGLESVISLPQIGGLLVFVLAGSLVVFSLTHELNLLSTGEELAASRGVALTSTKIGLFAAASLMVGAIVALCGPIGFVGLMAPHICRLLIGPDHRWLTPATALFGGAFLVGCDAVARTVLAPAELPVGIITALLGGPFFIWLLLGRGE
jgi:iron complex transport system permease protein